MTTIGKTTWVAMAKEYVPKLTIRELNDLYEAMSESIANEVKNGAALILPGIGRITIAERKERERRNPMTGEPVHCEAYKTFKLKSKIKF